MAEWRDKTRIPKGMRDYARWFRPEGVNKKITPTDIDGMLHTRNGNRFLMIELKNPHAGMPLGQRITMAGFSKLPGCSAMLIFDPLSNNDDREPYDDDMILLVRLFKDGLPAEHEITVGVLNDEIAKWFDNDGIFV